MARRRRGGLIDAADAPHDTVEILDLDPFGASSEPEVVEQQPQGGSTTKVLAGLLVGALATLGVVTAGNTPAPEPPEPPAPSVTVPPDPAAEAEAARAAEIFELEATYGVEIGDGPELRWHPVVWNIKTKAFQWIDDGFVGHDGDTEWTIRPGVLGPSVGQRQSPELAFPDYQLRLVDGARLLVPETATDHLLVIVGDTEPIRVELPAPTVVSADEADPVRRLWFDGALIDQQLVVARYDGANGAPEVGQTSLISIDLTDRTLAPVDLDGLQWIRDVTPTETGVAATWSDERGRAWLSTSNDGRAWSTTPLSVDDSLWFSGPRMYAAPSDDETTIQRSPDSGRTWQRTRRPFVGQPLVAVIDDILITSDQSFGVDLDQPTTIETRDYVVTITGGGRSFELADPETGEIVLSGTIDDSATAAAFDPFGAGLAIADPDSGENLLTIPQGALLQAFADASGAAPPELAITRWDPSADDPEWRIEPLNSIFNNAVAVRFVPGDGQLLAVVTTPRGSEFYVASTRPDAP